MSDINGNPVSMPRCHCNWEDRIIERARVALRDAISSHPNFRNNDLHADIVIEHIWNSIVSASGHDAKAKIIEFPASDIDQQIGGGGL